MSTTVSFRLNGEARTVRVASTAFLLDVVRDLGLTGTKEGCGVGVCGACTVMVDDQPVSACLYLAGCLDGADLWTVEGLTGRFPQVATAFEVHEGMQCGICTPGQVAMICALVLNRPNAGEDDVRTHLNGNLCRCTGYQTILRAAMSALSADPAS